MSGHDCPAPGCLVTKLPYAMLACPKHWYELPEDLRTRIWRTWRRTDTVAHRAAVAEAVEVWLARAKV